ncbi:MAG: TRAP transporter substrate-binding protein [Kiritimatiellae bacterium]|nr:TRAP transporter substrate-binding protein [Kiritimatiellia bacterium]MDD4735234.1 TRAP transporter substrate-binding protein [Kiritimatiellia bacterium]
MTNQKKMISTLCFSACIAVLCGCSPSGKTDKPITLTYANFPPASTFPCVQMERWKEEVEKRTKGKVAVQTFPGGTLLGAKDIFDGVKQGSADIGNFAMSYQPGRFPISEGVDLPIGFPSAYAATMTFCDVMDHFKPAEFNDVEVLTVFTCPPAAIMASAPVPALSALAGMELRVSGTGAELLKCLGGVPVAMPMSETPDALQKGVVQGLISSMEILKDMNFVSYCPHALRVNLNVVTFAVVMNKTKYAALPEDVKAVFQELYRDQAEWTARYVDQHVEDALVWSKENNPAFTLTNPSSEDEKQLLQCVQPILEDYVASVSAKGLPGEDVLAFIQAGRQKYAGK